METPEIRLLAGAELRASDEGIEKGFEGRLVPYNVFAPIGGTYEESIGPRCFEKSIREAAGSLPLMANHDHQKWPIGRSVEWDDREDGLHGRWVLADTEQALEVHKLVQSGMVRGLSCGFMPMREQETWETRRPPHLSRVTRHQARLVEASVVPIATWSQAVITVTRSSVAAPGGPLTPRLNAWRAWRDSLPV
jgi:HK97 family phage prohead protease